jgi:hypothetical protein
MAMLWRFVDVVIGIFTRSSMEHFEDDETFDIEDDDIFDVGKHRIWNKIAWSSLLSKFRCWLVLY